MACQQILDSNGKVVCDTLNSDTVVLEIDDEGFCWDEGNRVNFEFIALARNAFDVMMRRGWIAVQHCMTPGQETWIVLNKFKVAVERGGNSGVYFEAADPFTALVEADKWYKENVEKT